MGWKRATPGQFRPPLQRFPACSLPKVCFGRQKSPSSNPIQITIIFNLSNKLCPLRVIELCPHERCIRCLQVLQQQRHRPNRHSCRHLNCPTASKRGADRSIPQSDIVSRCKRFMFFHKSTRWNHGCWFPEQRWVLLPTMSKTSEKNVVV